jgi:hypothetical protein
MTRNVSDKMKKLLLPIALSFILGFLTHALLFPDFLNNGIVSVQQLALPNPSPTKNSVLDPLMTKVTFDGQKFSRHNITIGFTRYVQISNTSQDKLMWLISNDPNLTTPRGYGYSETIQKQFNKKGQFIVEDKNNPQEKLVITVK